MKQVTILSGKGGTGKTTLTAAFANLADNAVVADCDVDVPDLHILLHPETLQTLPFKGAKLARIEHSSCTECGLCKQECRFTAITKDFQIDSFACEGCGVCAYLCPENAIDLVGRISGKAYVSATPSGYLAHALLTPGESNSGKLVTQVRENAQKIAHEQQSNLILIDGPPGIGCPVISAITGVDAVLIVTEPTLSAMRDLDRVLQLLTHFDIPAYICINRSDINELNTQSITRFCHDKGIQILGTLPYSSLVNQALSQEKTIIEFASKSEIARDIKKIWQNLLAALKL